MEVSAETVRSSTVARRPSLTPVSTRLLQRKCACGGTAPSGECASCKQQDVLRRQPIGPDTSAYGAVPPSVHEVLRSSGNPLPPASRAFFESGFGHDFAKVRIHTDARASESARAVNARAYTVGRDIVFASGEYDPNSGAGRRLLAHELVHVAQQRSGDPAGAAHEAEAEASALASPLVAGAPMRVSHSSPTAMQRDEANGAADPWAPRASPDEQFIQSQYGDEGLSAYRRYKDRAAEIVEAHRIYKATGQIPQTSTPFSLIEIKEGRLMTRAERYDAMLKKQGKDNPVIGDLNADDRDAEFLTTREFHDEFFARHQAERDQCEDHWWSWLKGPTFKCQDKVDEKYGGPKFKPWKESQEAEDRRQNQVVTSKMEGVVNSGFFATMGRAAGGLIAWGAGKNTLAGSEFGADVGGLVDTGLFIWAGVKGQGRTASLPDPVPGEIDVGDIVSTPGIAGPLQVEAVKGDTAVLTPLIPQTEPGRALPAPRIPFAPGPGTSENTTGEPFGGQSSLPPGSVFLLQSPTPTFESAEQESLSSTPTSAKPATTQAHKELDPRQRLAAARALAATERNIAEERAWQQANPRSVPAVPAELVLRPDMSADLVQAVNSLPPLSEADERLSELQSLLERPDLKPEVISYLQTLARIAEAQARNEASETSSKVLATHETSLARDQENLRQASVTVKKLIETRGPNYRSKTKNTPYDEVMGKDEYAKLTKNRALSPDHLYSLHKIANSRAMTDLIEVFSRASASDKAAMLQKLPTIGDVPENLISMRSDANSKWKRESFFSELSPASGSMYYTEGQIQAMILEEPAAIRAVEKAIKDLADSYRK